MAKNLFEDFSPVSAKLWKQKIQFELKGADYNQTVIWNSPEGIKVKPFYDREDLSKKLTFNTKASDFRICQSIFVFDIQKSVKKALDAVERGADSLSFTIPDSSIDPKKLLEKLPLDRLQIYFHFQFLSIDFVKKIDTIALETKARIFCLLDPIGHLAQQGNWFTNSDKNNFDTLNSLKEQTKFVSFLSINGGLYQNAGANMVQQIAYSLSHANEYFNKVPKIDRPMVFQMSVGSNYFFEIAKLRAFRILFKIIADQYNHHLDCHLLVGPSRRNKTIYDYNVNMLRTTTECMSAILGGADAICNLPYDALYHKNNEFGDRIARNQLLILKNESYFDKIDNPADGSYYLESLSQQLAEKALVLFKSIEADGGYLKQLNERTIQTKIQESAQLEQARFDQGEDVLVGTNKYPNPSDRMKEDMELFPFVKIKTRKTLITPIIEKRLSEKWEKQRLQEEEKPLPEL